MPSYRELLQQVKSEIEEVDASGARVASANAKQKQLFCSSYENVHLFFCVACHVIRPPYDRFHHC